jgi:hypothetical protein
MTSGSSPVNAVCLHVLGDTGVTGNLLGALHAENVSQHRAGKQPERAGQRERRLRPRRKSARTMASPEIISTLVEAGFDGYAIDFVAGRRHTSCRRQLRRSENGPFLRSGASVRRLSGSRSDTGAQALVAGCTYKGYGAAAPAVWSHSPAEECFITAGPATHTPSTSRTRVPR